MLESGHHLGRGRGARDQCNPQVAAAGGDTRAEAGRDDEPGARVDGLVDLIRPHDGAGTDEQIRLGGDAPYCPDRGLRAERDLGDREAALGQRAGERKSGLEIVHDDHRQDPARADRVEHAGGAHRASQPPSTGRRAPQT